MAVDGGGGHYQFLSAHPHYVKHWPVLNEEMKGGYHTPWLLAYACTLQHMGEATEGRTWHPIGIHFTLQVSLLVDTFIEEMGVELTELKITSCWG